METSSRIAVELKYLFANINVDFRIAIFTVYYELYGHSVRME
jgi:hypothetical protein